MCRIVVNPLRRPTAAGHLATVEVIDDRFEIRRTQVNTHQVIHTLSPPTRLNVTKVFVND